MSVSGRSFKSASSFNARNTKRAQLEPTSPEAAFSNRFSSILFSLYNPQIDPNFDPFPPSNKKPFQQEELPPFESPLCSFKVKTEMEDDENKHQQLINEFSQRSAVLVTELSKSEYDIQVSMVPFDVERTAADRRNEQANRRKSEIRVAEAAQKRSQLTALRREEERQRKSEEDRKAFAERRAKFLEKKKKMEESSCPQ